MVSCPLPPLISSPHSQNKMEHTARRKETPWVFTLYLSLMCRFLPPLLLPHLILSGGTFPGSYILFYHTLGPHPFLVLCSSLILFALTPQEFLSLFISFPGFVLCFLISSLFSTLFTANVRANQCCCIARNKLPFFLT